MLRFYYVLFITISTMLTAPPFLAAQNTAADKIEEGIALHDDERYDDAIAAYRSALEIDPKSAMAYYELALTYLTLRDYKATVAAAKQATRLDSQGKIGLMSYVLWGTSLSEQEKFKQAIKTYQKGIDGGLESYLLPYNQGIVYSRQGNSTAAKAAFARSLDRHPTHPGSHHALATLAQEEGARFPALLGYYFYLLIQESNDKRAEQSINDIQRLLLSGIQKKEDGNFNLMIDAEALTDDDDPFQHLSVSLPLTLMADRLVADSLELSPLQRFSNQTQSFFDHLSMVNASFELDNHTSRYLTFFSALAETDHIPAFTAYLLTGLNQEADEWIQKHPVKMEAFKNWLIE